MKKNRLQILRAALCMVTIVLIENEFPAWWIAAIPWAVLSIVGIILAIPFLFIIGAGTGAAQADWMSDEFICIVIFIVPTILTMFASSIFRWIKRTKTMATEPVR